MSRFRILVFSDSHGKTDEMHRVLENEACDMVLHLGDCYNDMLELKECYDIPVHGVIGNVDYNEEITMLNMNIEGIKIFMCHGHQFRVKSQLALLENHGRSLGADIILFGHTHQAMARYTDVLFLNPGSIALPRNHVKPSYAVIDIIDKKISYEIVYI